MLSRGTTLRASIPAGGWLLRYIRMQFATRVVGNLPRRVKLWSTTFVLILPSTFVLILPSTVELAPESSYLTGENRQPGRFSKGVRQ